MSDWDDDDFEPNTDGLAPPPDVEETPIVAASTGPKPVKPKADINMESLGRELTAAEKEEIQRRNDLKVSRELFGIGDEDVEQTAYKDIITKEEFEEWGAKVGTFLATRHKAANYGYLINKLVISAADKLDAAEIRKISEHLKKLADSKKGEKSKPVNAGGAKKNKPTLKGGKGGGGNMYDDFGGGGNDNGDDYDDFM